MSSLTSIIAHLGISVAVNTACMGLNPAEADKAVTAAVANRIRAARDLPISPHFQAKWNDLNATTAAATAINDLLRPYDAQLETLVINSGCAGILLHWGLSFTGATEKAQDGCEPYPAADAPQVEEKPAAAHGSPTLGYEFTVVTTAPVKDPTEEEISQPRAAKTIYRDAAGDEKQRDYDSAKYFWFQSVNCPTHESFAGLFRDQLLGKPHCALVRGAPKVGLDLSQPHQRLYAEHHGDKRTLVSVPAAGSQSTSTASAFLSGTGRRVTPQRGASCPQRASAGISRRPHGRSCNGRHRPQGARNRAPASFILLDKPTSDAELYLYLTGLKATLKWIDPRAALTSQIIYTARPVFEGGAADPVPADKAICILPGDHDRVTLNIVPVKLKGERIRSDDARLRQHVGDRGLSGQGVGRRSRLF